MNAPMFHRDDQVTLYTGDAATTLATLPARSVDTVVTSPPYWGLRDYGTGTWTGGNDACGHRLDRSTDTCHACGATHHDEQHGLEPTPEAYVDRLRAVFAELWRVLAPTGTVWLNLGDSYSAEPPGHSPHAMRRSTLQGRANAAARRESVRRAGIDRTRRVPRKNLLGMPWRVALALQNDGWILRNAVVWAKTNPMPQSARDRLSTTYEFLFLLARQPDYHFDLDAIRVPAKTPPHPTATHKANTGRGKYSDQSTHRQPHGPALRPTGRKHDQSHPAGKNPGDVWRLPTRPGRDAHFAAFPIDIPLRCITATCPPRGTVLDPFSGTGTTGAAALSLERRYTGIELSDTYNRIAVQRLRPTRAGTES